MKVLTQKATATERAELDRLLAIRPELRAELEQLRNAARLAKVALPLVSATEATNGELPEYARGRLQTKVRETYGAARIAKNEETQGGLLRLRLAAGRVDLPTQNEESSGGLLRWRWLLGLATAAAVLALIVFPLLQSKPPLSIQIAMLDQAGPSRGTDTNEVTSLRQVWQGAPFESFSQTTKLEQWENSWPTNATGTTVKVIYDRSAGEVRVVGKRDGKQFQKSFEVDRKLSDTMAVVVAYVNDLSK